MSFGVSDGDDFECNSASPNGLFAKRSHLVTPWFHRMTADLVRFNRDARTLLAAGGDGPSLGHWLDSPPPLRGARARRPAPGRAHTATVAVVSLRVAHGFALVAAPHKITRSWLGPAVEGESTKVALRGLGGREIAIHAFGIVAMLRGQPVSTIHAFGIAAMLRGQPVSTWLLASLAGDVNDIAATFAGRSGLPGGSPPKTAAAAGGSAALTVAVLAAA
jgi:hypothetical protein